jgi:hypothetical protein
VGTHHDNLVNSSGTLAPGHSAGVTTIIGNYTQQSGGTLEIEIGGVAQGTQFDFVNVTEDVQLGGLLDLKRIGGFVPGPSQNFIIMSADAISGAFANVASGQRLAMNGGSGSFLVHYGPGSPFNPNQVVLSNFQASSGPAGDFDSDGYVDGRDFLVWQRGQSPNPNSAADLAAWRNNFGFSGLAASGTTIPEPRAEMLAFCLALCASLQQRRPF